MYKNTSVLGAHLKSNLRCNKKREITINNGMVAGYMDTQP